VATLKGIFPGFVNTVPGPLFGQSINIADTSGNAIGGVDGGNTSGGQLIIDCQAQPTLAEPWTITSWSVALQGFITNNSASHPFGRLGKIYVGLLNQLFTATPQPLATPQNPLIALPTDISNLQLLWDGASDPVFPAEFTPHFVGASFSLQQPFDLHSGDSLGIGLYLTSSLISHVAILLYNAQWSVDYSVTNLYRSRP
jgi:hypothetical protein